MARSPSLLTPPVEHGKAGGPAPAGRSMLLEYADYLGIDIVEDAGPPCPPPPTPPNSKHARTRARTYTHAHIHTYIPSSWAHTVAHLLRYS